MTVRLADIRCDEVSIEAVVANLRQCALRHARISDEGTIR